MSSCYEPLVPAVIALNENGTPTSTQFGDIYYAGASPLAQAREVFLHGNGVPGRWAGQSRFTVLETGFGLGHNFLALWQAWRDDPARCTRLHVVSIEAHPFTRADLTVLLDPLTGPERVLAKELIRAWPVLVPGVHRLEFESGAVTLTLAFGHVGRMAPQLDLGFDACFLDGFAPRLNPDMWTPRLFKQLARMANSGATLASWCSAGQVRRDLQDAGFLIQRQAGFGAKRHMITGRLRPNMRKKAGMAVPRSAIVVGSGFAGAAAAFALADRGQHVTVFDPALSVGTAGTHRGHRVAAMTPALSRDDDIRARLSRAGVMSGVLRWRSLGAAQPRRCGTFQPVHERDAQGWQRALQRLQFPPEWVRWADPSQAANLTGLSLTTAGLWHAQGHAVRPEALLEGLLASSSIRLDTRSVHRLAQNTDGQWSVYGLNGERMAQADVLIMATSWLTSRLLASVPDVLIPSRLCTLHRFAGQLSHFSEPAGRTPEAILAGDGLCMPDGQTAVIGGSTYVSGTTLSIITEQGHHENRQKVADLLEVQPSQLGNPRSMVDGWAGWRAAVRDRLPVIGAVPSAPGLWLACGFGSRGLTWSALAAELLAARLNHEPIPLERELSKKIAP